jgi:hypothetical protein
LADGDDSFDIERNDESDARTGGGGAGDCAGEATMDHEQSDLYRP